MSEWREVRLGDIAADVSYGFTASASDDDTGVKFLRTTDIVADHLDWAAVPYCKVSADDLAKFRLEPDDIVISRMGTVGVSALVRPTQDAVFASYLVRFRMDATRVVPRFVSYALQSPLFWGYVGASKTGSVQPNLNARLMRGFEFPLPPLAEQRAIAEVLGALDDKIESNRKIIATTRSLSTAVLAAVGKTESCCVGDLVEFHNRRRVPLSAKQRAEMPGPHPYYGATGIFDHLDQYLFDERLLLVGEDGSVVNVDGTPVTQYVWGRCWVNNHAHVLTGSAVSTELAYLLISRADVRPSITGAVQAKLSMGNLKAVEVEVPSKSELPSIESEIEPLFARLRIASQENSHLTALRDALLPELLSGRLRVPEAERLAEAVT